VDEHDAPSGRADPAPRVRVLSMPYARRLFAILAVLIAVLLGVRWALVPASFGETGHYRGLAPGEEAAREPSLQGSAVCGECHDDEFARHEKDIHVSVACEDCHGPGAEHVAAREADAPPDQGVMFRELVQANCLACHRKLRARPMLFPTVDVAKHFALVGVKDPETPCQACHDPHAPLSLERDVATARIHPLIHPCRDCHADDPVDGRPLPRGHVVTFQCKDCHADVVADFATRAHAALECRTCHLFQRDSDFSGRILKNGNPRFCLMCHLDRPFKAQDAMPLLASFEAHLDDVAESDADREKRCVDCHLAERIHRVSLGCAGVVSTPGGEQ